jgi:hypothetical protein
VGDRQAQAALARLQVRLAPCWQRLAAQRRRYTEQRIAARVAQLGFAAVGDSLPDRVVEQAWLLAEVAGELGAHRLTVHRLLERHGIQPTLEGLPPMIRLDRIRWPGTAPGRAPNGRRYRMARKVPTRNRVGH